MSVGYATFATWCVTFLPLVLLSHMHESALALPNGVRFAGALLYTAAVGSAAAYSMRVMMREFRLDEPVVNRTKQREQ